MATITQILPRRWPGREWSISEDDYGTLIWGHVEDAQVLNTNPEAKPDEATIRAFSNDVDLELAAEAKDQARDAALTIDAGQFFKAVDIMSDFMAETHRVLPNASKNAFNATILNRGQALRNRINEILAQFP